MAAGQSDQLIVEAGPFPRMEVPVAGVMPSESAGSLEGVGDRTQRDEFAYAVLRDGP